MREVTDKGQKRYYSSGKRGGRSPFAVLANLQWNVFEDVTAFKTYFNLLVGLVLVLAVHLAFDQSFSKAGAFLLCSGASLWALGLWSYGKVQGLPIFPAYAFTSFLTFALQIYLQENLYDTRRFFPPDPTNAWWAAGAVALFLLPGTALYYTLSNKPVIPPAQCHIISRAFASNLMFLMFVASSLVIAGLATEKFAFLGRLGSVLNAAAQTGTVVSLFILSYQFGQQKLPSAQVFIGGLFLALSVIATMASLFLGGAISVMAVAIAGYTLGKKRFPWLPILLLILILFILHGGKSEMRQKYWDQGRAVATVGFLDYPAFFLEWFNFGLADFEKDEYLREAEEEKGQNLLERSSLIEIFITAREMAPEHVPYLKGETYRHIPIMLVPRFLNPDKPVAHEGQRLLNTHYKIQSADAVLTTYIAWGLMNEAFANYGFVGLPIIGLVIAWFFTTVSRYCSGVPLFSFRGLLGALTLGFAIQAEMAAAVWVTSYAQSFILLILLRWVVMKPESNRAYPDSIPIQNSRVRPFRSLRATKNL